MPFNVEIKARASDWDAQLKSGLALAGRVERLTQTDTFFNCANGRLKLRRQRGAWDYLVFYRRPGLKGPKISDYRIVPLTAAAPVLRRFSKLLGVLKKVVKKRIVCLTGWTRIHFDEVKGLGRFIELEVVLRRGEAPAKGRLEAGKLMALLNIKKRDLVSGAYADMIED